MLESKTGSITVRVVSMGWKDDMLALDDNVDVSIVRVSSLYRSNNFDVCVSDIRIAYGNCRSMDTFE